MNTDTDWHWLRNETLLEQVEWVSDELKASLRAARLLALELEMPYVRLEHLLLALHRASPKAATQLEAAGLPASALEAYSQEQAAGWRDEAVAPGVWLDPALGGGALDLDLADDAEPPFGPEALLPVLLQAAQARELRARLRG